MGRSPSWTSDRTGANPFRAALFTAAGLELDTMLAAGPDSLKAHIAAIGAKDADVAAAQAKISEVEQKLSATVADLESAKAAHDALTATHAALCATVDFRPEAKDADGKPVEFSAAFKAHVAKEAALLLAKDGRPPVTHVSASKIERAQISRAAFDAMSPREQAAFCRAGGKINDETQK